MSHDEAWAVALNELLTHLMDGQISDEQLDQLRALLAQEPQARQYYVEYVALCANLRQYIGGCLDERVPDADRQAHSPVPIEPIASAESTRERQHRIEEYAQRQLDAFLAEQERLRKAQQSPTKPQRRFSLDMTQVGKKVDRFLVLLQRLVVGGALVASLILMIVAVNQYFTAHRVVAVVADSMNAKWENPVDKGDPLRRGRLRLEEGYARIVFRKGAEVVLQAPSTLQLESSNKMFLDNGWITAKVPKEAVGFMVASSGSSVVDFGTEFGLLVGADNNSEVHVFDGQVELQAGGNADSAKQSQRLEQGEAATTDGHGRIERAAVGNRPCLFVRQIPADGGFGIPGKRLGLADIVGGGNGLDTGLLGQNIDPSIGQISPVRTTAKNSLGRGFVTVPSLPVIDGVFVPDGGDRPPVISSTGLVFQDCPDTSGVYYEAIADSATFKPSGRGNIELGRLGGRTYGTREHPSIGMHANAGITLDLGKIRSTMPDVKIVRFRASCGVSETTADYPPGSVDFTKVVVGFWVLVDGQVRFHQKLAARPFETTRIDVSIDDEDRFLTLATTDSGAATSCWAMFAEPMLELVTKVKNQ